MMNKSSGVVSDLESRLQEIQSYLGMNNTLASERVLLGQYGVLLYELKGLDNVRAKSYVSWMVSYQQHKGRSVPDSTGDSS